MPTPQNWKNSCGVGAGNTTHPTKLEKFLWGGRPARPWHDLKRSFATDLKSDRLTDAIALLNPPIYPQFSSEEVGGFYFVLQLVSPQSQR